MSPVHVGVRPPQVADALVQRFAALPTTVVSDQMGRNGGISGLRPVPGMALEAHIAGRALTVETRGGDNLALHRAIDLALPGDVLIVSGIGEAPRAVMGEIVYRYAMWKGIVGFVLDGYIRDSVPIGKGAAPVLCRGITPLGAHRDGPGAVHSAVTIDGLAVEPGSIVVVDYDGAAVVPADMAAEVAIAGEKALVAEAATLKAADDGTLDRRWVEIASASSQVQQ